MRSADAKAAEAKASDEDGPVTMPITACIAVLAAACHRATPAATAQHLPSLCRVLQLTLKPQQPWPLRMAAFRLMSAAVLAAGGLAEGPEVGVAPLGTMGRIPEAASVVACAELIACAAAAGEDKTSQVRAPAFLLQISGVSRSAFER